MTPPAPTQQPRCQVAGCGAWAPFGFGEPDKPARYWCAAHKGEGEAWFAARILAAGGQATDAGIVGPGLPRQEGLL